VLSAGELLMILDLHRQGLSVSGIARRLDLDRKTLRKYLERGLEPPAYGRRAPRMSSHRQPTLPQARKNAIDIVSGIVEITDTVCA
jgi:transposase